MARVFGKYAILLIFTGLIFSSSYASAQDLGSSSGIFRSPNTSTKTSSSNTTTRTKAKTPAVKTKKPTPKPVAKTNNKPARNVNRPTRQQRETVSNNQIRTQASVVNPQPQSTVVITVGDNTTGDFDELFEQSVEEGNTARDVRDYLRAEAAYRRAQNLKSNDSRAVYGLGNIYADQQRWEEAERAYRQAILLEPNEAGA